MPGSARSFAQRVSDCCGSRSIIATVRPGLGPGGGEMGEHRGLAGAALLLREGDAVAHMLCLLCRGPHIIGSAAQRKDYSWRPADSRRRPAEHGEGLGGEQPRQLGGRQRAAERRGLAGPERHEVVGAGRLGGRPQRRQRAAGEREGRRERRDRPDLAHHPVDDAAGRAAGEDVGQRRLAPGGVVQRLAVQAGDGRLGAEEVGGADLRPRRPRARRRRRCPRPSAMPPAAITGTRDRVDDLRHQREGADLRLDAVGRGTCRGGRRPRGPGR